MSYNIQEIVKTDQDRIKHIQYLLRFLRQDYPDFQNWWNTKILPQLGEQRKIIVAQSNKNEDISGIMILKNHACEKKICTLWVQEKYRKQGLGSCFMEYAIRNLCTVHPLITVSEETCDEFLPLLGKFKFKFMKSYNGYYREGIREYSFNGLLESNLHLKVG